MENMMSDLVKNLRELATLHAEEDLIPQASTVYGQAADTIEQLQQRVGELESERQALAAHVERFKQGVYHFNRSHGDMSPLLRALTESPQTSLDEARASAIEEAVELYTHKLDSTDEMNQVSIDIIKKGKGFIYPEGLLEHANKIRNGEQNENIS